MLPSARSRESNAAYEEGGFFENNTEVQPRMLQIMCWFQVRLGALRATLSEETGQALVEYGLILALIAAVCIALIATLGGDIKTAFTTITSTIEHP
jgi:pilus assembly protein Flp/PilA